MTPINQEMKAHSPCNPPTHTHQIHYILKEIDCVYTKSQHCNLIIIRQYQTACKFGIRTTVLAQTSLAQLLNVLLCKEYRTEHCLNK